ncbi:MAG: hypothetical protein ACE5ID_00605 [Acidobacteriota bacterium]
MVSRSNRALVLLPVLILLGSGQMGMVRAEVQLEASALEDYTERVQTGFIDWGLGMAEVKVTATYDTVRFGGGHAMIRAREEADKKAEDALFRLLRGVNINGDRRLLGSPEMEKVLRKVIHKQMKIKDKRTADLTLTATYQVPIFGKKAVADSLRGSLEEDALKPGELAGKGGGGYSSVLFDATGTSLQAALYPRVFGAAGDLLYGPGDLSEKGWAKGSSATYLVPSQASGKKSGLPKALARRLGNNPLVLKVQKIKGILLADVELHEEQEQTLKDAGVGDLLAAGHVFFLQTASVDVTQ